MPRAPTSQSHIGSDDADDKTRVNDIQARKKRNADAQAAFRQRRATYISSLEETVVSLEAVVVKLQDSCREARAEADSLRQERDRLRHEGREREKMWRALWQGQRSSQGPPSPDGIPPVPDIFAQSPVLQQAPIPSTPPTTSIPNTYTNDADATRYAVASNGTAAAYANGSYAQQPQQQQQHYVGNTAATMQYTTVSNGHPTHDARTTYAGNNQTVKYNNNYGPYAVTAAQQGRDQVWSQGVNAPTSTAAEATASGHTASSSQSPMHYADHSSAPSPVLTYGSRYMVDSGSSLDQSGYVMDQSPTISAPSTPVSTSSTATTSYPFTYTEAQPNTGYERSDGIYARPHNGHTVGMGLTLHGGTADISALVSSNRGGYRPTSSKGRPESMGIVSLIPGLPSAGTKSTSPVLERGRQSTRDATSSSRSQDSGSRSPSPANDSPISGTLAVIKAQAFGTTRRNARMRTKKSAQHAKMAIEALEARGNTLGLGASVVAGRKPIKRQRVNSDDEDAQV